MKVASGIQSPQLFIVHSPAPRQQGDGVVCLTTQWGPHHSIHLPLALRSLWHVSSSRMYEINGEVEGFAISGMMIDRRIKQSRARLYNYQEKPLKHQKRSPKADRVRVISRLL